MQWGQLGTEAAVAYIPSHSCPTLAPPRDISSEGDYPGTPPAPLVLVLGHHSYPRSLCGPLRICH